MLFLLSMAFRVDDPETAYNESDTPINLAIPMATDLAANVKPLVQTSVIGIAARGLRLDQGNGLIKSVTTVQCGRGSKPRLKLLCTLIC